MKLWSISAHISSILMALLSALLFGAATPASKVLLDGLSAFQLAGLLYLGAAMAVAPAAFSKGGFALPQRNDRKNRIRLAGAVLFGGILGPVALLLGLQTSEAVSVSLWLNLELAATAVLGVLLFQDHLGPRGWWGVIAALGGSVLLTWSPGNTSFVSGILVLLACLCWGLDNHLTALIDGIAPSQSTLWKGTVAGSMNLIIGISLSEFSAPVQTVLTALGIGALSYGASIILYILSAQKLGATRAQVLFATAPFFGVALSVIVIGESLSFTYLIAIPIFLIGIGLLLLEEHQHEHSHSEMIHYHYHRHDDGHHTHDHAEFSASVYHAHTHTHAPLTHAHPHWPDLHHRHQHPPDA